MSAAPAIRMKASGGLLARRLDVVKIGRRREHGDRLRYMAGCRCTPCRAANSRYETERLRARKNGDWNGCVPAAKARAHLLKLSRRGVGTRAIADASGVARSILRAVARGEKQQ